MQPTYLSWVGYFDLIDQADVFVFLDTVQLVKRSWAIRNRIKTAQGELYLSIPIQKTGSRNDTMLNQAVIFSGEPWQKTHLKSIELAYRKAPFFETVFPVVKHCLYHPERHLSRFNIYFIQTLCDKMGLEKTFVTASDLPDLQGTKDDLLVSICQALDCDGYLSAQGSAAYIEQHTAGGAFARNNLGLHYHQYQHPTYPQCHGEFLPYMGIIDMLFNTGFDHALALIRSGRQPAMDYQRFRQDVLNL